MEIRPPSSVRATAPPRPLAFAAPTGPVDGFTPTATDPATRLEQVVDGLATSPLGWMDRRTILKAARGLGLENMEKLAAAGVKIRILNDFEAPSMRAEYLPHKKALQLSPGRVSAETMRHELGHALDDIAEADAADRSWLKSEKDEKLQGLYEAYKAQVEGSSWWSRHFGSTMFSDYATHNVHEYLAEGIMLHTGSERSQRKLEKSDPGLAAYLGDFLARS